MATTTRRTVLRNAALATTLLATPFVRGAHAAGKLSVGFWDHWVPGANEPLRKLCEEWAEKEKVELKVDFITSNGDKDLLTVAAEAQAKTGHDIQSFTAWYAPGYAESLEPADDMMAALIKEHGPVSDGAAYLGKQDGHWVAVPTSFGSTLSPPCARIDLLKQIVGLDITRMYPAGAPPDKELEAAWTWDFFAQAAVLRQTDFDLRVRVNFASRVSHIDFFERREHHVVALGFGHTHREVVAAHHHVLRRADDRRAVGRAENVARAHHERVRFHLGLDR